MDGEMMDSIFDSLLESTGGLSDIHRAIKSKDHAQIVRAAIGALKKTLSIPMRQWERKSANLSNQFRKEGNLHFINKNFRDALPCYNKALAYAPNGSIEIKLAYSNMSAATLAIKAYDACKRNSQAALEPDCPAFLRDKIKKRLEETDKINFTMLQDSILRCDKDMLKYVEFDVKKNDEVQSVSADVFIGDDKRIVAANDVKSGTMVAMEKAFVSAHDKFNEYICCYYCHKLDFFFVPCEGCCKALFCSNECRAKCLDDYHRVECEIVGYMGSMYLAAENRLAIRAAIKMSLKLSWDELKVASLEMGQKLFEKSSVKEIFDVNSPVSLLCYDDRVPVDRKTMVNASLICASAVHCLDRATDYLPEDENEREVAIDSLSRIMLHLKTTFVRNITGYSSAYDLFTEIHSCGVLRSEGMFSFASKLRHACEPNLLIVGFNDHVGLVALRRIKKGQELTVSFCAHFYELDLPPGGKNMRLRQKMVQNRLKFVCECRVCTQDWDGQSHRRGQLTSSQKNAYMKYQMALMKFRFVDKMKAVSAGLDELTGCENTTQHYELYGFLRKTLTTCQCVRDMNKIYGGVGKYIFSIAAKE